MKVTNLWESKQKPTISFELFPARSPKGAESLEKALGELAALEPDFVSVTFGAGGSTREGSRQLIEKLKGEMGLSVMAYFAGYGLGPADINSVLDNYKEIGIENLLVVRGDPPHDDKDFVPHPESMQYASDLLEYIRERYSFCPGAAGYPETHIEAESPDKDIDALKLKVDKGASYIISNYFYDNSYYYKFLERCSGAGIDVPILPGIMPIYSVKMMDMLAKLCGATITDEIRKGLSALPEGDTEALLNFGIEFATAQCRELLAKGVPGLHIYTMDRSASTAGILNNLRNEGLL